MRRALLVFVDGVGLARAAATNPLSRVPTPGLESLLGGPLTVEEMGERDGTMLRGIDACLGVDGLPQSATGQTSLFTGRNAAAAMGRHVTAFPGPRLRALLLEHSMFRRARSAGLRGAFANAFSRRYFELVESRRLRYSASVWAARAADLPLRDLDHLRRGEAVSWDVVGDHLARGEGEEAVVITPHEAGAHLGVLAGTHHLTLYETFLTDLVGHGRLGLGAAEVLRRLDGLLLGLLATLAHDVTLVLTSDHGNFEDSSHRRHTRNPVPLLVHGRGAAAFREVESLVDVVPALLAWLTGAH